MRARGAGGSEEGPARLRFGFSVLQELEQRLRSAPGSSLLADILHQVRAGLSRLSRLSLDREPAVGP